LPNSEVLVDGHNALHRLGLKSGNHEADRRELLIRVREVDPRAVVWFDARGAPPGLPESTREHGVRVRYARRTEADRAILDRVLDADRPGRLLVVTNDIEMARKARQLGAKTATVDSWFDPGSGPDESADDKPDPGGLSPEDFDLPKFVNLDHPPGDMREE
jgi:hypothetical protein